MNVEVAVDASASGSEGNQGTFNNHLTSRSK